MKEEYLKKINHLYKEICDIESLDKNPNNLVDLVKQILGQILKLIQFDGNMHYLRNYDALNYTLKREIDCVGGAYIKKIKKNAAKARNQEYNVELNKAIGQIRIDLIGLLER